jgi:CheY-like chemotaxis protein
LPHLSGPEVIRRARDIRPGLPAIIITGYAEAIAAEFSADNIVAVTKPFTPLQLKDAIRRAMECPCQSGAALAEAQRPPSASQRCPHGPAARRGVSTLPQPHLNLQGHLCASTP